MNCAGARMDWHRQIAVDRQVSLWHPVVRSHQPITRISRHIRASYRGLASKRRSKQCGRPRPSEALKRLAWRARQGVELERVAVLVCRVEKERTELGAGKLSPNVRDGLQQRVEVERGREQSAGLVQQLQQPGLVAKHRLGLLPRGDVETGTSETGRGSIVTVERSCSGLDPMRASVGPDDAELDL